MLDEGANYRPGHVGYAAENRDARNRDAKTNDCEHSGRSSVGSSTAGETTHPGGDGSKARCWISMLDGLSLKQEGADFGVEAGGLFHVRGMTCVGDDDEAGSVDAIAHLFTADEGRAGIIGAPD
jgi:hypothetical protein